jgi:excisionase family DNA binding protein
MNIEQRYLNLNQTATYLGMSPKTIYSWVEGGKIPAYKLGRVWRFDRQELDHFVRSSQQMNGPKVELVPEFSLRASGV